MLPIIVTRRLTMEETTKDNDIFYKPSPPLYLRGMHRQRQEMITQALREKKPEMYKQLQASGELKRFVRNKEEALMQEFEQEDSQIAAEMAASDLPHLERVQTHNTKILMAWKSALRNNLEF